jgi:plastocyanin
MTRTRIGLVIGLALLALAVAGCGGSDNESSSTTTETTTSTDTTTTAASGTTLNASVGPGFDISLKDADGADVTTLTAGTYTIEVDDQSDIHNFHLSGPGGVDVATEVGETGTTSWQVTFEAGSYHFQCDPHASQMNGDFEVT